MTFLYEGVDQSGNRRRGRISASSKEEAYRTLMEEGIRPIFLKKEGGRSFVSWEDLSLLLLQLSHMLRSGMPLAQAVESLALQEDKLSGPLLQIKESLEKGNAIPEAFASAGVFPSFLIEMLRAAERGENLEKILETAGQFLQRMGQIKAKAIGSLAYPLFVLALSFLSLVVSSQMVVPKIASVLKDMGKDLPLITKMVLLTSTVAFYGLLVFVGVILLFPFWRRWFSEERLGYLLLKLPFLGNFFYLVDVQRFASILAVTLSSGVALPRAVDLSIRTITNPYLKSRLRELPQEISKGKSLGVTLQETEVMPQLFINLVKTGEKSGDLERMLELCADIYQQRIEKLVSLWLRLIEPVAVLIMGVVVGLVVMSVLLPLTEVSTGVR
ncbi:Type II secretion system F domain protein [Thermocrinis albus DSM 14484]|uniref:Type II secretion system F domain protein n=1 Tax=Thermocrinis albus (strain DSM 14484 / JCM 11386 / HI 11/12) TaxID=638303 RepID=D3SMB1_THEAH|nr:type II secretion system F family protein [Thermocrinis albus]ADC89891.1 Type II secretion system F domain protein [Thermocrinis albus DSM 14484]